MSDHERAVRVPYGMAPIHAVHPHPTHDGPRTVCGALIWPGDPDVDLDTTDPAQRCRTCWPLTTGGTT